MDDLRELAEAATPGPWGQTKCRTAAHSEEDTEGWVAQKVQACDSAFISAANPQAVLALIGERDTLKIELDSIRTMATTGLDADVSTDTALEVFACWKSAALKAVDAWAEQDKTIDPLKKMQTELIEMLANTLKPLWRERDALAAQVKRLRTAVLFYTEGSGQGDTVEDLLQEMDAHG